MPIIPNPPDRKKTGPPPMCNCGMCSVCKNRERQKRFREKQKLRNDLIDPSQLDDKIDSFLSARRDDV